MDVHSPGPKLYRQRIRETVVLFSLFVVPGLLAPTSAGIMEHATSAVLATMVRNIAFTLLILYLADLHQESAHILGRFSSWKSVGSGIAVGLIGLALIFGFLARLFEIDSATAVTTVSGEITTFSGWFWFGLLMLSAAFVEEIFFRGYLLARFRQLGLQPLPAVVSSALLFSLGHGYQGLSALLYSFSAGIFLGIFWLRKPNLIGFAIGHGIYNIVAVMIAT